MGKASRRKAARRGAASTTSNFLTGMAEPLDPDVFKMMVEVWQAASSMSMPTENPQESKIHLADTGDTISFTDNGLNRGMMAVTRQCREIGIENPQGYTARLMHLPDIFDAQERFGELMVAGADGGLSVHGSVLTAAATAKFYASPERMGFDIDDLIAKAQALAKA